MTQRENKDTPELERRVTRLETQVETLLAVGFVKSKNDSDVFPSLSGWLSETGKMLGSLLGSVLGAASLFYVLGFVIVNVHLFSLGIRDLALDRLTYLAAGIGFLVVHAALTALVIFLRFNVFNARVVRKGRELSRLERFSSFLVMWLISSLLLGFLLSYMLTSSSSIAIIKQLIYVIIANSVICVAVNGFGETFLDRRLSALVSSKSNQLLEASRLPEGRQILMILNLHVMAGIGFSAVLLFALLLSSWAKFIYPGLSPAFGGGMPTPVQLVLADANDAPAFAQVGIDSTDLLTEPVRLVDVSEGGLIVLVDDGNAVRLDREKVASILYLAPDEGVASPSSTATPSANPTP